MAVVFGTILHELSHAFALRAFGISFEMEWLPNRKHSGLLRASIAGGWASVRPLSLPSGLSPWSLRIAALMPLLLATPIVFIIVGVVPDPFGTGNPYVTAAAIGWLGCAIPSPQDFSLVWYAEQAIEEDLLHDTV